MQGASEGVRDRVRSHRNETSSVKESESAVGRNVQKGVRGKEPKERTSRECHERERRERGSKLARNICRRANETFALDFVLCCE